MTSRNAANRFDWRFSCREVAWSLHFEPNPPDVRQGRVSRDGELWMCADLERVWHAMQREMGPPRWVDTMGVDGKPASDLW